MKRNILLSLMALLGIFILTSCGGKIKPTDLTIKGEMGQYFDVLSKKYNVTNGKTVIELRRIREGMPEGWTSNMELGTNDGEYEVGFTLELRDSDDAIVMKSNSTLSNNADELKEIVALKVGETGSITFDASGKAATFTISSDFQVHKAKEKTAETVNPKPDPKPKPEPKPEPIKPRDPNHVQLSGRISGCKGSVHMTLDFDGSSVSGSYYYSNVGKPLYLSGYRNGNEVVLDEYTDNNGNTGTFYGTYNGSTYSGTMDSNYSGSSHSFTLRVK